MGSWIHDGFLDSRWVPGLTMDTWIHDGVLDSNGFTMDRTGYQDPGFTVDSKILVPRYLGEPVLGDGGTSFSAYPNRYPFFTVRTPQASLVGE